MNSVLKLKKSQLKFNPKLILFVVLVLIIFNIPLVSRQTRNFFYSFSTPIQKSFWGVGRSTSSFFQALVNFKKLKSENDELKLKVKELLLRNTAIIELKRENEILRSALGIGLEKEFGLIMVEVTGKIIGQDAVFINKGLKDGVSENLSVITQEKVLVGRVKEVYDNFSKVILISDKQEIFNIEISRDEEGFTDNIAGVANGVGNFELSLKLIPKEKEVKENDIVITSALGEVFPKGLLVGSIQQVQGVDIEPFWQIKVRPAFNIQDLEKVFLILKR